MANLFSKDATDEPRDSLGRWATEAGRKAAKKVRQAVTAGAPGIVGAAVSAASFGSAPAEVAEQAGEHIVGAAKYTAAKLSSLPWRRMATKVVKDQGAKRGTDDMAGLTIKKLDALQKMTEAVFDGDTEQLEEITKSFDGLRAAMKTGAEVTMDDLSDILGDVMVEKAVNQVNTPAVVETPDDPIAPILFGLYKSLFEDDGTIKKGVDATSAQGLFNKAYTEGLTVLDQSIEAAVEATAVEFGKADGKKPKVIASPDDDHDGDNDEDCEDMEKLLKGMGVAPAVITRIAKLQATVEALEAKDALQGFQKQAVEIGESEAFGAELLQLHQASPKLAEAITKRLKAKNALLAKSNVWSTEIGAGDGNGGNEVGIAKLNALAHELVSKGEKDAKGKPMTFAKAFAEVCTRHPDIYAEFRAEEERKRR
jgi:hypothetical protein